MQRTLAAILLGAALLGNPSGPKASDSELKDGFELGKFFVSSTMLALEIESIQTLAAEFSLELPSANQLPGEANALGQADPYMAHAYAIWRLHGLIIPLCEGGLQEGALDPDVLGPIAGNAQLVLADIYLVAKQFAANEEISGVAQFASQAETQDFVNRLLGLAKGAKLKVNPGEPGGGSSGDS